ncbi:hypothetical protein NUW54_g13636 [Trametes sanguinea]|uniref:Uncharacterized protein n=1 Tax=Trametes sanguinea TaxID=158606 RepID=A0ACC1MJK1_9APHY|nr:hypothetical protein NUW54_g13636 [Trametes sanguinea]
MPIDRLQAPLAARSQSSNLRAGKAQQAPIEPPKLRSRPASGTTPADRPDSNRVEPGTGTQHEAFHGTQRTQLERAAPRASPRRTSGSDSLIAMARSVVRNCWTKNLSKKGWATTLRARIHLRRTLGREPTQEEVDGADTRKEKYDHIQPSIIDDAFVAGEETDEQQCIETWSMNSIDVLHAPEPTKPTPEAVPERASEYAAVLPHRSRLQPEERDRLLQGLRRAQEAWGCVRCRR